jgi:ADP-dependent phosphofructokinase/glucokinase
MLKNLIESYDPYKVTSDEIGGLTEMLKHDSFKSLHELIIKKIKEIEAVVQTRKKLMKQTRIQRGKVTKKRTSMPMTESDDSKMMDEMMPILWFTYLVDKEFSKNFDKKKPKDDKPKDP